MKKLMVLMPVVLLALSAGAASEVVDGVTWNYSVSGGKATITSGMTPCVDDLTIPPLLGDYPVTKIGDSAFYGCDGLTTVTIPEGVTCIGRYAFRGCSRLRSVEIPSSVTSILDLAFFDCSGLREVSIPSSVTSIGYQVFSRCSGLTSITIPSSVTSVGYAAFSGCSGLTVVTIPSSVASIGEFAFNNCKGLTSVTIPTGVLRIENSVFSGCNGLLSVTIPSSVTSIGDFAFDGCGGVQSVTIPSSVESIGEYAFRDCKNLTSVMIPSSVTSIGYEAFRGCSGLKLVEFLGMPPSGVSGSYLLNYGVSYPREYCAEWRQQVNINRFNGYRQPSKPKVEIISAAIRENDPTVMDVVYRVKSVKPTVKVRTLAFQDGERSFAKVVRSTEFIEDTAANIGDAIAANVEHKLSWRVSADWKIDLAKMKFEVLASAGDLLPLELMTIPKVGGHAAMEISWNAIVEPQVFDALLWLYADGDEGLELVDSVLKRKSDGYLLAYGTTVSTLNGRYSKNVTGNGSTYYYFTPAIDYVYSKMGFFVLSDDELEYANKMTRLGLSPSGVRQYAWRTVEE